MVGQAYGWKVYFVGDKGIENRNESEDHNQRFLLGEKENPNFY